MPEGDTIHGAADRLNVALAGATIETTGGSHRAMIEFGRRIVGTEVVAATAYGKQLLIDFSNAWTLRTHMRMTGSWHLYEPGERWRITPGKARAVLETPHRVAVCFTAPTVQLAPRHVVIATIGDLGPDLMGDFDLAATITRMYELGAAETIGNTVIDQRVVAGIGNVYKSELLFLEGIHPDTMTGAIDRSALESLLRRAHKLLVANRGAPRTTTGSRSHGSDTWVYGRAGLGCRRCGTAIITGRRGPLARTTFWCPSCQPPPDGGWTGQ